MEKPHPHRAVVVGDNQEKLRLIALLIEKDGVAVSLYPEVEAALRGMAESGPPDIIVTDLNMPGIDGWRFCRMLRSPLYPAYNKTPIVVISSNFQGEHLRQVTAGAGANAFLPAPHHVSRIRACVQALLQGHPVQAAANVLILVANNSQAGVMRGAFEVRGYQVHLASGMDHARQLFREHVPEIVVLECGVGDVPTEKLLPEFRQPGSGAAVVLIAADPSAERHLKLARLGADGCVRAPFEPEDLVAVCEQARRERALLRVAERLEQRTAELQESERKLRLITENATDVIFAYDMERRLIHINPAIEKVTGRTVGDLHATEFVHLLHPEDRPRAVKLWEETFAGKTHDGEEFRIVAKDGEVRWLRSSWGPLRDENGRQIGIQGRETDVTGRKRAEEQIKALNGKLARRAEELEASNRDLEAFSYTVSHDLREPLVCIEGFSRRLEEKFGSALPPGAMQSVQCMRDCTRRMGQLIDDLLRLSRMGFAPVKKQRVDPAGIARQAIAELRPRTEGRRVEIAIGDLPPCEADPALLKQVYVNLLSNAIKYTREREVAKIEVGSASHRGESVYFVRDNGAGFDMKHARKVFAAFHRAHSSQQFEGTGVGLAIVQRIVERHGGRVWAEAEVGKGATFFFSI